MHNSCIDVRKYLTKLLESEALLFLVTLLFPLQVIVKELSSDRGRDAYKVETLVNFTMQKD